MMTGPRSQEPTQPVSTTLISSPRPWRTSSARNASDTARHPDETQPAPAQTITCDRYAAIRCDLLGLIPRLARARPSPHLSPTAGALQPAPLRYLSISSPTLLGFTRR